MELRSGLVIGLVVFGIHHDTGRDRQRGSCRRIEPGYSSDGIKAPVITPEVNRIVYVVSACRSDDDLGELEVKTVYIPIQLKRSERDIGQIE